MQAAARRLEINMLLDGIKIQMMQYLYHLFGCPCFLAQQRQDPGSWDTQKELDLGSGDTQRELDLGSGDTQKELDFK